MLKSQVEMRNLEKLALSEKLKGKCALGPFPKCFGD
jgi:hypothetical protein